MWKDHGLLKDILSQTISLSDSELEILLVDGEPLIYGLAGLKNLVMLEKEQNNKNNLAEAGIRTLEHIAAHMLFGIHECLISILSRHAP